MKLRGCASLCHPSTVFIFDTAVMCHFRKVSRPPVRPHLLSGAPKMRTALAPKLRTAYS